MINIYIIEDSPSDYNMIENHLNICRLNLKKNNDLKINIKGIKCRDKNPYSERFWKDFFQEYIDILVLDYELYWEDDISFNGLRVLDKIKKNQLNSLPYVIFTSSRFDAYKNIISDFSLELTSSFKNHAIHVKSKFLNEKNFEDTTEILKIALKNISPRIEFNLISYPFGANKYDNYTQFKWKFLQHKSAVRSKKVIFEHQFIAILIGYRNKYCLIYLEENNIKLEIIEYGDKYTQSAVRSNLMNNGFKTEDNLKIIYNPKYIFISKEKNNFNVDETIINFNSSLNYQIISKFYIEIQEEIKTIKHKVMDKNKVEDKYKVKNELEEEYINPFIKIFERIKII